MSSSRSNHALEKTNKTMSATGRKLMIVAVILLALVIIVLIAGVVLIHKKIASLKGALTDDYFFVYIPVDLVTISEICPIKCRT